MFCACNDFYYKNIYNIIKFFNTKIQSYLQYVTINITTT